MEIITKEQLSRKALKNLLITSFSRLFSVFNFLSVLMDRANNLSANQLHKDEFFHQNTWFIYMCKIIVWKFQSLSQIKVLNRTHEKEATLLRFPRKVICIVLNIVSSQHKTWQRNYPRSRCLMQTFNLPLQIKNN